MADVTKEKDNLWWVAFIIPRETKKDEPTVHGPFLVTADSRDQAGVRATAQLTDPTILKNADVQVRPF